MASPVVREPAVVNAKVVRGAPSMPLTAIMSASRSATRSSKFVVTEFSFFHGNGRINGGDTRRAVPVGSSATKARSPSVSSSDELIKEFLLLLTQRHTRETEFYVLGAALIRVLNVGRVAQSPTTMPHSGTLR